MGYFPVGFDSRVIINARKMFMIGRSSQSNKNFTMVNYDSRVVPDLKLPNITTLES